MAPIAGIDLGATNLRAAVADGTGELLADQRVATPNHRDGSKVARSVANTLETTAERAGVQLAALEAVGIGTIGPLDRASGTVIQPPNLDGVEQIPLRDALIPLIGHPRVYVENDAIAGLVGERWAADEPASDLVYLTISTGIGAGVAVDDHILRGRSGNAAEVGHLVVEPDGRTCGCGKRGHWEAYSSGRAIPEFAGDLAESLDLDTDLSIDSPDFTAPDVFDAVGTDQLADRLVEAVAAYNAIGVADLLHAYAPDRIAVGGAVALENPLLMIDPLTEAISQHTMLAVPEIAPARLGRDAVLRGAVALAAQGGL